MEEFSELRIKTARKRAIEALNEHDSTRWEWKDEAAGKFVDALADLIAEKYGLRVPEDGDAPLGRVP